MNEGDIVPQFYFRKTPVFYGKIPAAKLPEYP